MQHFLVKIEVASKAIKVVDFFKIPFVSSSLWSEKITIFGHTCWVTLRRVAGPRPFLVKKIKFGYFFQNFVCIE